jgi:hypothetical protein
MATSNNQEKDGIDRSLIARPYLPEVAPGVSGGSVGAGVPYYRPTVPNTTNTAPVRAPNATPPITNTIVRPSTIGIPAPQGESGSSSAPSSIPARSGIGTIPTTVRGIRLQPTPSRTSTPLVRPGYDPQTDIDRGDGRYTGPVLPTAPEPWTTPAVSPGNGQRPKPNHRRQPNPSNPNPSDLPPLISYPPGQNPIEIENRNRAEQEARESQNNRNRTVTDQDGNQWHPGGSEAPISTPQPQILPTLPPDDWMRGSPVRLPTTPTRILAPAPRFNTTPDNQLDLTRRIPQSTPSDQTIRANQQQPANNNSQGDRSEPSNAADEASSPTSEQAATSNSTRTDSVIKKQEAKKRRVEREVAKLSDADRAISNLPDGLEKRLNDVGYIINRGDKPSIAYRGTTEHGKLPSGSQLHLADGENGTKE